MTSVQTNSLNPKLTAAVTEPSLNAELGCIKVVDTFRSAMLFFLCEDVPAHRREWCDPVTDYYCAINPREFRIIG